MSSPSLTRCDALQVHIWRQLWSAHTQSGAASASRVVQKAQRPPPYLAHRSAKQCRHQNTLAAGAREPPDSCVCSTLYSHLDLPLKGTELALHVVSVVLVLALRLDGQHVVWPHRDLRSTWLPSPFWEYAPLIAAKHDADGGRARGTIESSSSKHSGQAEA